MKKYPRAAIRYIPEDGGCSRKLRQLDSDAQRKASKIEKAHTKKYASTNVPCGIFRGCIGLLVTRSCIGLLVAMKATDLLTPHMAFEWHMSIYNFGQHYAIVIHLAGRGRYCGLIRAPASHARNGITHANLRPSAGLCLPTCVLSLLEAPQS